MADTKEKADTTGGAAAQALGIARLRSSSTASCFAALLGLAGMIIQNEVAWYYNTIARFGPLCPDATDETCDPRATAHMWPMTNQLVAVDAIRAVLITIPTFALLISTVWFYGALLSLEQSKNRQPASATLLSVPHLRWRLFVELGLLSVHVFPGIEGLYPQKDQYGPDLYLFLSQVRERVGLLGGAALYHASLPDPSQFMFVRLLLIVRAVRFHSSLNSSRGRFIG